MSRAGIRLADWGQRLVSGVLAVSTLWLGYKVYGGRKVVMAKIKGEEQERLQRMEDDLKRWKEEDEKKAEQITANKN